MRFDFYLLQFLDRYFVSSVAISVFNDANSIVGLI
jgi:hypothetical protein